MEESGSVVYYEGSPGALLANDEEQEELVVRDEGEGLLISPQPATSNHYRWYLFSQKGLFIADERIHLEEIVSEIKDSPLLTEEDLHLLLSAIEDPSHTHSVSKSTPNTSSWLAWKWWMYYILPAVIVIGWLLHSNSLFLIVGVALLIVTVVTIRKICFNWLKHVISESRTKRSEYYSAMDKLLTQLTTTIRWIQEAEVIGWGLTRPLTSLPARRLDQLHTHQLLRRRVLHTCRNVLVPLRRLTRQLFSTAEGRLKLADELEDKGSYLAFRQLHMLHMHMWEDSEEVGGAQKEEAEHGNQGFWDEEEEVVGTELGGRQGIAEKEMEQLSLESIKDACSLVAVQNSELLRRLCLTAAAAAGSMPCPQHPRPPLPRLVGVLSQHLGTLVPLLKDSEQQLEWSLKYHKNMLFGSPPTRPVSTDHTQTDSDLRPLLDEVHCMDLKAQNLLQRVRDMGVSLAEDHTLPPRELLESQLQAVEVDMRGLVEIVDSVSALVRKRDDQGTDISYDGSKCSLVTEDDDNEEAEDPKGRRGQDCSDDYSEEEVFEGCAQEDEESGRGQWEEEEEMVSPQQEVPAHMMTELKGVLTVRNHEKAKRRLLRRHKNATPPPQQDVSDVCAPLQDSSLSPRDTLSGSEKPQDTFLRLQDTAQVLKDIEYLQDTPSALQDTAKSLVTDHLPIDQDTRISSQGTECFQDTAESLQVMEQLQDTKPSLFESKLHELATVESSEVAEQQFPQLPSDPSPIMYSHTLSPEMAAAIRRRKHIQNEQTFTD